MAAPNNPPNPKIWPWVLACIAFALVLKLPSLGFLPNDPDEIVYWEVAGSLLRGDGYSLQSSSILSELPPTIYDRPLFHHPPLFPVLLMPFVAIQQPGWAVVLAWSGHILVLLALGLVARTELVPGSLSLLWGIPLLAAATDPLLIFVTRRLWIDGLMTGLMALAIALSLVGVRTGRRRWLLMAGVVLGLAGLAKLPGLLAAPLILFVIWVESGSTLEKARATAWVATPAFLIMLPWWLVFFSTYGMLAPNWLRPTAYSLENFDFVAAAVGRPWYYYLVKLLLIQPLLAVVLVLSWRPPPRSWLPGIWCVLLLAVPTVQGALGYGFQMRYVAPLVPSLFVFLLMRREWMEKPWAVGAISISMVFSAMSGAAYLVTSRFHELATAPEVLGWFRW